MANVVPHPTVVRMIRAELTGLMPELLQCAERYLRKVGIVRRDRRAQPGDAVANAVVCAYGGTRPMEDDTTLKEHLCDIMWSQVGHIGRDERRRRQVDLDDAPEVAAPSSQCGEMIDGHRCVGELQQEIDGDEDVRALYVLLADSEDEMTHAAQARALGWTGARHRATLERLRRRFRKVRARREGLDDESSEREGSPSDPPPAGRRTGRGGA